VKLPFRKKKRFLVKLTARGKQLPLGIVEAKDSKELMSKLTDLLQQNENAKNYPAIRILDLETGVETKISNPFSEVEDTYQTERGGKSGESFLEVLADETLRQNLLGAFTFLSQLFATVTKGFGEAYVSVMKDMMVELAKVKNPPPEEGRSQLRDIVEAGKLLLEMYRAWATDPQKFNEFFQKKVASFLGATLKTEGERK
jgi:hypothetical protein